MRKAPFVIGGVVLTAAFLLNPMVGLDLLGLGDGGVAGPSARDMAAAVSGTWELRFEGEPAARTVVITPARSRPATAHASWVAPAAACSEHTVIASAAACIDAWTMPLVVEVTDGVAPVAGVGAYRVEAGGFDYLTLTIGRDELGGELVDGRATLVARGTRRTATLVRRPR
ncbi:MAG: hypothetical protein JNK64_34400 [Myxococcales bacterium]|nr:hypothetical protein [Myxococcales bacterium]